MNIEESLLSEDCLSEGAFRLLTCSSSSRYIRMAKSLAHTSNLVKGMDSGELSLQEVLNRARTLWHDMQSKNLRGLEEIELTTILAAIASNADDEVSAILVEISLADRQPVTWVSALARRLNQDRRDSAESTLELRGAMKIDESSVITAARGKSRTKTIGARNWMIIGQVQLGLDNINSRNSPYIGVR